MRLITRKSEVKTLLEPCLKEYYENGLNGCIDELYERLLSQKVKFPLLEYCGVFFYENLSKKNHISFCDKIQSLKTEGGNVILGIMLQKRLEKHFEQSLSKATEYIADADIWYICDIIGERVFGFSLLHQPEKTIPEIRKLSKHPSNWVIRSLGAGIHYAIKKGLPAKHVSVLFSILLTMANTRDKEIRQGVGWAAKTTARFHPEVIKRYAKKIADEKNVANWFRRKIMIGLDRERYAKRNNS